MKLDKMQEEIVRSESKDILVIAGSGSGKTRTLVERVRYLLEEKKVEPSGIVCITFTNASADEMRIRLKDVKGIGDAFIGTIHSFANSIYKESGLSYQIMSTEVTIALYKEITNRYKFEFITLERLLERLDREADVQKGLLDSVDVDPRHFFEPSELSDYKEIETHIAMIRKQRNIITFDELLIKTQQYYATLDTSVEYVLLDEAQDVGILEYKFISGLNAENTFIVGDDWQNIYTFKGADVSIFKNIAQDKNVKVYHLSNNYRSAKEILDVAERIIKQVPDIIEKDVVVKNNKKGSVTIDSKNKVGQYLDRIRKTGDYNDWFILCRSNKEVVQLLDWLRERNIPADTFKRGGMTLEEMNMQLAFPSVKVLTVHTSKGLENKNVLLYGRFPMKIPKWMSGKSAYEERRVMYVGCTRAEEKLIILN